MIINKDKYYIGKYKAMDDSGMFIVSVLSGEEINNIRENNDIEVIKNVIDTHGGAIQYIRSYTDAVDRIVAFDEMMKVHGSVRFCSLADTPFPISTTGSLKYDRSNLTLPMVQKYPLEALNDIRHHEQKIMELCVELAEFIDNLTDQELIDEIAKRGWEGKLTKTHTVEIKK